MAGEIFGNWGGSSDQNKRNTRAQQSVICWLVYSTRKGKKNNNKVKLNVTHNKGWKKRSFGRIYESSSGHAFIIDEISKEVIVMVLYSKAFQNFDAEENIGKEAEEHEWPKSFKGN